MAGWGPGPHRGIERSKTHVVAFQDHAGNQALSSWRGVEKCALPKLYSHAIYFTHPKVRPDAPDAIESARRLHEKVLSHGVYDTNDVEFRFDMYFIPNGTWDDCMRHYRAERDARGSFWAQIEALEQSGGVPPPAAAAASDPEGGEESKNGVRMPGMVPSYIRDGGSDRYHAIIHICDAADWRGGDDEVMTRLEFEPLSREEYEEFEKDPGDPREPDELPETKAVLEAVHDGSPRYGKPRSAEEPWSAVNSMGMHLYRIAALEDRGGVPQWQRARNEGWTSW